MLETMRTWSVNHAPVWIKTVAPTIHALASAKMI